jgi:DNA-binding transcriptional ArsR family regulator
MNRPAPGSSPKPDRDPHRARTTEASGNCVRYHSAPRSGIARPWTHLDSSEFAAHDAGAFAKLRSTDCPLTNPLVSSNLPFVSTYRSADAVWNILGDRTRRAIVELLAEQPMAVVEIAERLPVSRPAVSQHLKVLKDTGLVSEDAVGRRHVYHLNPTGIGALRDQLDTFWSRTLAGYEATVDQITEDQT